MIARYEMYDDVLELARILVEGSPMTIDRKGNNYTGSGYAVGGAGEEIVLSLDEPYENKIQLVARLIQRTSTQVKYFGSWIEGDKIYFEAVDIVDDYMEAFMLSVERNQKAFYDFDNQVEHFVKETEGE
jgi:hypothetical protein